MAQAKKAGVKKTAAKKKAAPKKAAPTKPIARPAKERAALAKAYDRVRAMCLGHENVIEKLSWGEATFRVEKGTMFLSFADDHHGDGRVAVWCRSTADSREAWLQLDAWRFYIPPYVGPSGWIGVRLEGDVPWDALDEIIAEGVRLSAPKRRAAPARPTDARARSKR